MSNTIWKCKIGVQRNIILPPGSDKPMRKAISEAFYKLTGVEAEFFFSGWGAELTDMEKTVVDKKDPGI